MSKFLKIMAKVMPVLMVVVLIGSSVLGISPTEPPKGEEIGTITGFASNIWATVAVVLQILAIAAIVIAGVRYMFASADAKADIKGQTVTIVVGALLVFAAVPIAKFIQKVGNELF